MPKWPAALVAAVGLLLASPQPSAAVAVVAADDAEAGRQVFEANCAMCHGSDASGMMDVHPSLRGAVERLSLRGVEVTIRQGRDVTPPMPSFEDRLTDEQTNDVVAYIASLPVGPRNFGTGEQMMGDNGMMNGGMTDGFWLLWVLLVLVLIALAVVALVWLVRNLRATGRSSDTPAEHSSVRVELDRRYAAGEVSRDDYLQRRQDLES
ncbi:hypothetical protein BH20ACT9_BH20ACT9_03270 [soil metagenome]